MGANRDSVRSVLWSGVVFAAAVFAAVPAWAARGGSDRIHATEGADTSATRPIRYVVKSGDTLSGILAAHGLGARAIAECAAAMRHAANVKRVLLRPNHGLLLELAGRGRLVKFTYELDDETRVAVERSAHGWRGHREAVPVTVSIAGAQGVVERNLHRAALRAGVPDRVISRMADILGWEVDFRGVQRGDRFRVVYERRVAPNGRVLAPGRILAAELRTARRTVQAFLYKDGDETTYVDAEGRTLTQSLLRYPVEFTRISSGFSRRRFHPILKKHRPHNGVDFAAPAGTPVRAAGDGIVTWAGRNGDFGNHVALQHAKGVVTTYSHLRGIARSVRPGTRVHQGQIIGWVGQTGLATGPHLHFALFRNNQYINPLTARIALQRQVRDPARFQQVKRVLLHELASVALPVNGGIVEPLTLAGLAPGQRPGLVMLTR